jgi:hypothetical protein
MEIERELTRKEVEWQLAMRNRGGRPKERDIDQELVEGWTNAQRLGTKKKQAFVKKWFKGKHDRAATQEEVWKYVRRLDRELVRLKGEMPVAGAGESTGAVSEPDAPNTPVRK